MTQLNEIDASKEIDAIEKHLLALIEQMHFKCKTNDRLEQHTTALNCSRNKNNSTAKIPPHNILTLFLMTLPAVIMMVTNLMAILNSSELNE